MTAILNSPYEHIVTYSWNSGDDNFLLTSRVSISWEEYGKIFILNTDDSQVPWKIEFGQDLKMFIKFFLTHVKSSIMPVSTMQFRDQFSAKNMPDLIYPI